MSTTSPTTEPALDAAETERRFELVNRARIERIMSALPPRQRDFLHLLPVLFHTNHPSLPGYTGADTPVGIMDFTPSPQGLRAAREVSPAFAPHGRALPRHHLYGLYLIGSIGSIGQSRGSDFDLWLCHDETLEEEAIRSLISKAEAIEQFAAERSLEVHFFVFSPEDYRLGRSLGLSSESSGSSQHFLLLDEFYRSGLVLAGVNPLWWRIPSSDERRYDMARERLLEERAITPHSHADFGGITDVPMNEFFGAALWQLSKGIDSPHKSVLKLLLMEAYARNYPQTTLLSHRYKQLIEQEVTDPEQLDAYLLMYRAVEEYLEQTGDTERLALVRRALYFKVDEPLSKPARGTDDWRRELLLALSRRWRWSTFDLLHLDGREHWRIEEVAEERRALVNCFKKSYHVLSEIAKNIDDSRITREDLTILGRKLYAAFERKSGKLELVNRGIAAHSSEPELVIECSGLGASSGTGSFEMLRPQRSGEQDRKRPIKRSHSLMALVSWAFLNRVADGQTRWWLKGQTGPISEYDLRFLHETVHEATAPLLEVKAETADFHHSARIDHCLVLVNLGCEGVIGHGPTGHVMTSVQTDAFEFGGTGRNLVARVDVLVRTTWGEYFSHEFSGDDALPATAAMLSKWRFRSADGSKLRVACASEGYRVVIEQRVKRYLDGVLDLIASARQSNLVHVTRIGGRAFAVIHTPGKTRETALKGLTDLERVCEDLPAHETRVMFDESYFVGDPVAQVFKARQAGCWQLFMVEAEDGSGDFAVLDEYGRLFWQQRTGEPANLLIAHYWRFLSTIHERRNRESVSTETLIPPIEVFRLARASRGEWRLNTMELSPPAPGSYLEFRVIGEMQDSRLREVVLVCGDEEYSSTDFGRDVYRAAAEHVLEQRQGNGSYPIYVTDMDIRNTLTDNPDAPPIPLPRLLRYRAVVEKRLSEEVVSLHARRRADANI